MATTRSTSGSGSAGTRPRRTSTPPERGGSATAKVGPASATAEVRIPISEVRKPLYASVGVADVAVEKLRSLPSSAGVEVRRLTDRVGELSVEAVKVPTQVGSAMRGFPDAVGSQLSDLQGRATHLYNTWANRGEKRVSGIRRNPATEEAMMRTRTAVSQTRAARTSTRKAADAVGKAVSNVAGSK
jgi:hypothetical protein